MRVWRRLFFAVQPDDDLGWEDWEWEMEFLEFTDVLLRLAMMKVQHPPLILDPCPLLGRLSRPNRLRRAVHCAALLLPICATSLGWCTS